MEGEICCRVGVLTGSEPINFKSVDLAVYGIKDYPVCGDCSPDALGKIVHFVR